MDISATAQAFWIASIAGETLLVATILFRRQYRAFPIFLAWLVVSSVSDAPLYWIAHSGSELTYQRAYIISSILDYTLQLGVLLEIARAVLYPNRKGMSVKVLGYFSSVGIVCFGVVALWALSKSSLESFSIIGSRLLRVNFLFAYLRLAAFALIAGFSQMLGITWKNLVIRLAGGLAFYSAVSVVVQLTISHLNRTDPNAYISDFQMLSRVEITSFIAALAFWIWSFVQKDAPRKEFTPQMQRFLVTMSQTARRSRLGLTRSLGHK